MKILFWGIKSAFLVGAIILGAFILIGLFAPFFQFADSLAHFRLHFSLLLVGSVLVLLTLKCWRMVSFLMCIAIAGLSSIDFTVNAKSTHNSNQFTVLQFNLLFNNKSPDDVIHYIRKTAPDVIMLQEVSRKNMKIVEALSGGYPNKTVCPFASVGAVVVLSRFPVAGREPSGCQDGRGLGWLRVVVKGKAISFASIHLHWPYPFGQNKQISDLQKVLEVIPRPIVVAGDFNAAPWSYAVRKLSKATDTRVVGGVRFTLALTFSGKKLPFYLPIDHILLPEAFSLKEILVGPSVGSDHSAVVTRVFFRRSTYL